MWWIAVVGAGGCAADVDSAGDVSLEPVVSPTPSPIVPRVPAHLEVTAENFESVVTEHPIVVIGFWKDDCRVCTSFLPAFDSAARKHPELQFGVLDTESHRDFAVSMGVEQIPTVMVYRERIRVMEKSGAFPAVLLDTALGRVKELDMEEVRRRVRADEAPGGPR